MSYPGVKPAIYDCFGHRSVYGFFIKFMNMQITYKLHTCYGFGLNVFGRVAHTALVTVEFQRHSVRW